MDTPRPMKTIAEVFAEFLAEQKARLSHQSYRKYASIIDLLRLYLESYGPRHEQADYRRSTEAGGTFCGTFGPADILRALPSSSATSCPARWPPATTRTG